MKKIALFLFCFLASGFSVQAQTIDDAIRAYKSYEYTKAYNIFKEYADKGDAVARSNLGSIYRFNELSFS